MSAVSKGRRLLRRRWPRVLGATALACLVIGFGALETFRFIASRRGVESVALPRGSEAEARSASADYVDAYRARLSTPVPLASIERFVFQGGARVASTSNEVVFESGAPGLRLLISYYLTDPSPEQSVTVSTVVFYESVVGAIYFTPVQQVHKRGVPFIVWRVSNSVSRSSASRPSESRANKSLRRMALRAAAELTRSAD
jgi:hypothetical protein